MILNCQEDNLCYLLFASLDNMSLESSKKEVRESNLVQEQSLSFKVGPSWMMVVCVCMGRGIKMAVLLCLKMYAYTL